MKAYCAWCGELAALVEDKETAEWVCRECVAIVEEVKREDAP